MRKTRVDIKEEHARKSLREIARLVDGEISGNPEVVISGACGIREAQPGDITFLSHTKHLPLLEKSQASAVIVGPDVEWSDKPTIRTPNPSVAFLAILDLWKIKMDIPRSIHPTAVISSKAEVAKNVAIGPHCVIEDNCVIGEGTIIRSHVYVGRGTRIGQNAVIEPHVTIHENTLLGDRVILHPGAVIGADGYGYETVEGKHIKIPQLGHVEIQEDVEIGANSCVDRARFGKTLIKRGTKIDNLVQIAHNVTIGENCLIVAQVGIAGSTELGNQVVLAAQVGVVGHIKIGANTIIGAQSGVFTSVPENSVLLGSPPRPIREEKERIVYMSRLPQLFKDVKQLKKQLGDKPSA